MTLSGLLNALDGVATPHGLITVMTTNNIDTLDDALLRAGRADRVVEFSYPTKDQVDRMLLKFCPEARYLMFATDRPLREGMTTADIVETVKRHLESTPDVLAQALEETLYGTGAQSVNH
jgi:ATP-dependent 26S proteasome regulatory subunit